MRLAIKTFGLLFSMTPEDNTACPCVRIIVQLIVTSEVDIAVCRQRIIPLANVQDNSTVNSNFRG